MPQFLFQLKGKEKPDSYSNWAWPPIWSDKVEAASSKEAKAIIEQDFGKKFPSRVLAKDLESNEFLLVLKEIKPDDKFTLALWDTHLCKQCDRPFTTIEKYQQGNPGGGRDFCCWECGEEFRKVEKIRGSESMILEGNHVPVIYRITNKITGMCYVGQTTQAFTLRWYQHFFQGCGTDFHKHIKAHKITDWIFEVVEIVEIPADMKDYLAARRFITEREMHHIKLNDSIKNGYNTVASIAEKSDLTIENQLQIFNEISCNQLNQSGELSQ